eukprot:12590821-Alexandrium_andersonii.AAC.1
MSASLVGSEMCIRDRGTCTSTTVHVWTGQGAAPTIGEAPRHTSEPPQPVSYTHLTLPTICSV